MIQCSNGRNDMDGQSLEQHYQSALTQGDISPKCLKGGGRGKKKQQRDSSVPPGTGIQTRRALRILEPFQDPDKMEDYRIRLNMHTAAANISGKIWIFVDEMFEMEIIHDHMQHITIKLKAQGMQEALLITVVYAKCTQVERRVLWESLEDIAENCNSPWMIGGDFNVITSEEEKYGGLSVRNQFLQTVYPNIDIQHLVRSGSDHASMLISYAGNSEPFRKPFKFLNFWVKHHTFLDIVKENWDVDFMANPFSLFHFKLKKIKAALVIWSKNTFGNIFQQIESLEDIIKAQEVQFELHPSPQNRENLHKVQAELNRYLHLKEAFWKQKVGMQWFDDGDSNTKFFHTYVQGRRKRLQIRRIQGQNGVWLEEREEVVNEAISFFQDQFAKEPDPSNFGILDHVPRMVTEEQNDRITVLPNKEEVKEIVFKLNGESAAGPDGFTGLFYQFCWDIIGEDVTNMVKSFFCGTELPRFVTHTNLVLLPKKDLVNTFSDMRPISLSNFSNKIFSRLIHERLADGLQGMISLNQAGFVKGRSIVENVLLTQEIVSDIRLRTKTANVVLKLDMAKAYDRVSWLFLTKVMRQMGYSHMVVDMIFRIVSNNWYSILLNGQQHGFFQSSRGVKQGDPLSPTLFILAAEVLSRNLNQLHQIPHFKGYGLPKWSPKINHLAYADDMIIFASADIISLQKIMEVLKRYEETSGQKVNRDKNSVYMHHNVTGDIKAIVEVIIGIGRKDFPFTYLGCPIFYSRRKKDYYNSILVKIMQRLQSWKGKMLSFGGRAVLIKHVLQGMPIHLLSALNPPDCVITQMHKLFAQFFWNNTSGGKSRHWSAWHKLCIAEKEGGLGFRSLHDVSMALYCKIWWKFRTSPSLWSVYLNNKYCKKENAVVVQWKYGSQNWKNMLQARDLIEQHIWWQTKMGNALFWYDNWTGLGALYYVTTGDTYDDRIQNVSEMVIDGNWDVARLELILPGDVVQHIRDTITPTVMTEEKDIHWWLLDSKGDFTVKSAWDYLRLRGQENEIYKYMWIKGLPFKISFFMWRCWKFKVPLDDVLKRMNINLASRCWCCSNPKEETIQHLFARSFSANRTWSFFSSLAGINIEGLQLQQIIVKWWQQPVNNRLKPVFYAMPAIVLWELWKRRNAYKHGERKSVGRCIYQIYVTIQNLVRFRNPSIQQIPHSWKDMLQLLEGYITQVKYKKVIWKPPLRGWIMCNTDGASRGNHGRGSFGFCVRNEEGNLIFARAAEIGHVTNNEAEIVAILEAIRWCNNNQFNRIIIQSDSQFVQKILKEGWKPPWSLANWVDEIKSMGEGKQVTYTHILHEGNQLADALANRALDKGTTVYEHFNEMEVELRKILNSDKSQVPYLRVQIK
ncbi:uncharacterized protein LOC132639369 [Lycium barbarum]|uniref:uncharacterized protein LOC132639369 n=1 Tax=Lycium barbarum TaxID=112863 RepID=UPI00293E1EFD|nr:uncharacterized protein LOC132639369 [Lycium barbarum]